MGLAHPGGVEQGYRITVEIEMHLNNVASGAGMRRHNRRLPPGNPVEQRRLARIRRAGDSDHEAVAQALALRRTRKGFRDFTFQRGDPGQRRRDQFLGYIALVGEIDPRLDQRRRLDDPLPPTLSPGAERAFQLPQRLAPLPVGVGVDQVVEALGFCEIQLAVLKGAAGEFAGLGGPQSLQGTDCLKHRSQHGPTAMDMQLGNVFAGRAVRLRKPESNRFVERLPAGITNRRQCCDARNRPPPDEVVQDLPRPLSGDPNDGNGRWRPTR